MNRNDIADGLYQYSGTIRTISTHSHHLPDEAHHQLGLESLLTNSYVSWAAGPPPQRKADRAAYIKSAAHNSYFHYLELSLRALYHIDEKLDENTWALFDEAISQAHRDKHHHLKLLTRDCGYTRVINDSYWSPGSDQGHPEVFAPAFRVNMFFYAYSADARDHNDNNPFQVFGWDAAMSFDAYLEKLDSITAQMKQKGCVALKSALAYDRGLDFKPVQKSAAQKGFMRDDAQAEDIIAFQDYIYFEFCRLSAKYDLPFQNHTGLGLLDKSNALQLREAIKAHPATSFCLMHGSYPFVQDMAGLVHNYANVYADLCWLPLISPSAGRRLVRELVEVGTAKTMMWGCDTWTAEESYGALLAAREALSQSLADLVAERYMTLHEAERLITQILHDNPKELFNL